MPAIGRLPTPWAYAAARLRGRWAAARGRDWVELSLGLQYIHSRTQAAWRTAFPAAPQAAVDAWARARYETWVEEELEAGWMAQGAWHRFAALDLGPARQVLTEASGRGLVLVQAHYNNPTLACAAVGMATDRPVWMTVSGVYEHPQVHPCLRDLFRGKYRGAESRLHGGRLLHSESPASMRQLYRALERGDVVIVVADLPPEPGQDGVCVPWLGGTRLLAGGAHRLAARTGSRVGSLWLQAPAPGRWDLNLAVEDDPTVDVAIRRAYARLAEVLSGHPGRWWAAHLLPETPACVLGPPDAGLEPVVLSEP